MPLPQLLPPLLPLQLLLPPQLPLQLLLPQQLPLQQLLPPLLPPPQLPTMSGSNKMRYLSEALNPFQSNLSANSILHSSYLF
jgi:hypothetical protein